MEKAYITVDSQAIAVDKDGFLKDTAAWTNNVACYLAQLEGIKLTSQHWEILWLARCFYHEFERPPTMRPLVNYVTKQLGPSKGRSAYLLHLFPDSPAKIASKIAGLPKPNNCL